MTSVLPSDCPKASLYFPHCAGHRQALQSGSVFLRSGSLMQASILFIPLLVGTFLAAGVVQGVAGMGVPTVAMGLLGTVMCPPAAAALLVIPSLVTTVWQLFSGPSVAQQLRRLGPMMLCIILGTLGGASLL